MSEERHLEDYGIPVVYLLKGILHQEQEQPWNLLLRHHGRIREYLGAIGLVLEINEADGFAFVKQKDIPDEFSEVYPKLVQKRQLGYIPTILCILLRKRLIESERSSDPRPMVSHEQIVEQTKVFLNSTMTHEKKQRDKIDTAIKKLIEYGFLIELKNEKEKYEINKVLNNYMDIDTLKSIELKLANYKDEIQIQSQES